MESVVDIEHLSKVYEKGEEKRIVLDDLSVEIPFGRFTSIRGRSGSGKSTLLNLIAGIDEPTTGQIVIGDHRINQMSLRERAHFRRDNIGFVFQFFNLIPTLTVLENVSLPSELSGRKRA
jgi:putative ABC transport system ATP-binding protein